MNSLKVRALAYYKIQELEKISVESFIAFNPLLIERIAPHPLVTKE